MRNHLYIYTDGSTLATGAGPSGYAAVIKDGDVTRELSLGYTLSTNNRMELLGVIVALEGLSSLRRITITSDSQYMKEGITKWVYGWKNRGWTKADGGNVVNVDLWKRLDDARKGHIITWEWVKGHSGHPENERCDVLAKAAAANPTEIDEGYVTHNVNVPKVNYGNHNVHHHRPWYKKNKRW